MKRIIILVMLLMFSSLLLLPLGCSASKTENGNDSRRDEQTARYEQGLTEGYEDGYDRGFADGKNDAYDAEPQSIPGSDEYYRSGYEEGYSEGYEDGYEAARAEIADGRDSENGEELEVVEAAMIAFVKDNAAPGLEFRIDNLEIHGDEAAGLAVCTNERHENALVIMKKGASGWYGVDFGTGIEPPSWYTYY